MQPQDYMNFHVPQPFPGNAPEWVLWAIDDADSDPVDTLDVFATIIMDYGAPVKIAWVNLYMYQYWAAWRRGWEWQRI